VIINSNGFGDFLVVKGSGFNMENVFGRQEDPEDFIKVKINRARANLTWLKGINFNLARFNGFKNDVFGKNCHRGDEYYASFLLISKRGWYT